MLKAVIVVLTFALASSTVVIRTPSLTKDYSPWPAQTKHSQCPTPVPSQLFLSSHTVPFLLLRPIVGEDERKPVQSHPPCQLNSSDHNPVEIAFGFGCGFDDSLWLVKGIGDYNGWEQQPSEFRGGVVEYIWVEFDFQWFFIVICGQYIPGLPAIISHGVQYGAESGRQRT